MKVNDFSIPRRMSKSAFVVFFFKSFQSSASAILVFFIINIFNIDNETSFGEIALMFLASMAGFIVMSAVIAFFKYYFKKYYVEDGNLIFIHGVIEKERTSIPLHKIHSLRTKRGFVYRIMDMRGVSFDTLASNRAEIELILDDKDWNALLSRVEIQEKDLEESYIAAQKEIPTEQTANLDVSNLNLLKGALCQNHFKGMAVLLGIVFTLYDQIISVNDNVTEYFIDYVGTYANPSSFSLSAFITVVAIFYVVILILWMGKISLRYFNMDIRMNEKQLFFESGLISRNSSRFSYDKICTVYIKRNIIERWLGCCTIMLEQALNATDEKKGTDVKIYGSDYAERFLNWWLGKNYTSSQDIISAQSGYGMLCYTIRFDILISLLATIVLCYYELYFWFIAPVIYVLISLAKGFFAVHQSRITLKEDYIEISTGKFAEIKNYFKYSNIEVVRMVSTPFTPHFHKVSLVISTNGTSFTIRSLREQEAKDIYELLLLRCSNA